MHRISPHASKSWILTTFSALFATTQRTSNGRATRAASGRLLAVRYLRQYVALLVVLACSDSPTAPKPGTFTPSSMALARIACVVDVRSAVISCPGTDVSSSTVGYALAPSVGGSSNLMLGRQNALVSLSSTDPSYAGQIFSFNSTVTNLIPQPLGTRDGLTPDPDGIRVFFSVNPTATGGSGTIDFVDPTSGGSLVDGFATFTATRQAFYQYAGPLTLGQTSSPKRWRFHVPNTVTSFTFSVDINAAVPNEQGWVDITPNATTLRTGQTATLGGVVRNVVGDALTGTTVAWSSSAPSIATVNASTGLVTAVTEGSATITGTSILAGVTRTGTATITVGAASAATTTITAAPTTLAAGATATVTVQAKTAGGANFALGGDAVVLSTDGGTLSAVTDHGDGTYTATLTSAAARQAHVSGTINGVAIAQTATVTFTAGGPSNIAKTAGDGQTAAISTTVAVAPTVRVTDANGNPVAGVNVTFAVVSGGGSVTGANQTTGADGTAAVGSWTMGATAGANALSATASGLIATFAATATAGEPAAIAKSAGDGQSVNVSTAVAIAPAVLVSDKNGLPLAGVVVTFAVASGGGSITGATPTTNAQGIATVGSWTLGSVVGANTLTASVGALTATFTATGNINGSILKIAGDAQTASVNTAVPTAPSVRVVDANGVARVGVVVNFAVASGGGSVGGPAQATDQNGVATVGSWTLGPTAGANTLTATTGALSTTFSATGNVPSSGGGGGTVLIPTSIAISAGDAQSAVVGNAVAVAPAVLVTTSSGTPVPNVTVTFAVVSGGGSVVGGTAATNTTGIATVGSWKLGTTAGPNTLSATMGSSSVTFTATGTPAAAGSITKSAGDGQTAVVGTSATTAPKVLVTDANGNPKPGVTVTFAVVKGGGTVTGATQVTDPNGLATVGSWTLGTTAGLDSLSATAGALSTTFGATAIAGAAANLAKQANGDNQSAVAANPVAIAPAVLVTDSHANPVAGVAVTFAIASGGGTLTGGTATTNASGIATIGSWTLGATVGPNTLTASATGLTTVTFSATGTVGAAGTPIKVAGTDNQTATVGTAVPNAPSVKITDSNNNPVSGVTVVFAVASGGGSVTGASQVTPATGIATIGSWTLGLKAGTNTLTATANGLTATFVATGTPGAVTQLQLLLPGETAAPATGTGKTGTPIAQTAGTSFTVTVNAVDANFNVNTTATPTVHFAASGDQLSPTLPADAALVAGTHTYSVTLKTVSTTATLTASTTGGITLSTSPAVTVGPGAVDHFLVEATGGGTIATQTAGTPFAIKVTAQDANNNIATSFNSTVTLTVANSQFSGATTAIASQAFTNGVLTPQNITLIKDGSGVTITAANVAATGTSLPSAAFVVNPGALHHFLVQDAAGNALVSQIAGTQFPIKITAQDINGNTATGFTGTATLSITNSSFISTTVTTNSFTAGVLASHNVTLARAAANVTITATKTSSTEAGSSAPFTVVAGAATQLQLLLPGETATPAVSPGKSGTPTAQAAGTAFTVTVNAVDANWNFVNTATTTVHFASNNPNSPVLPADQALSGGTRTYTNGVTLTTVANPATITASDPSGTSPLTSSQSSVVVGAGALHHFVVHNGSDVALTDQTAGTPFGLIVTAQDANNNTVTTFTSTVSLTTVNSKFTGNTTSITSNAFLGGVLTQNVTLTLAASLVTISATDTPSSATGASASITVNPGALHHFLVQDAAGNALTSEIAGTQFGIKITAQDINNNTATSFSGTATLTVTNSLFTGTTLTTNNFSAGVLTPAHNVTLKLAASGVILTATKTSSTETGNSAPFTVVAGAATQLQLLLPGETATPAVSPGKSGTPTAQVAGTAFSVTVNAVDANWNFVNTAATTVHFASNNPNSPVLPADQALSGGTRTYTGVTLKTVANPATITASDPSGTSPLASSLSSVVVGAGALNHFVVHNGSDLALTDQTAGTPFGLTVTAQDANNNTVTTFTSTVTLTTVNSKFTGNTTSITSNAFLGGVLTQNVTLTLAASLVTISATDTPSSATGASASITVNPGALHHFAVQDAAGNALTSEIAGTQFGIKITAQDINGNTATSFTGTATLSVTGSFFTGTTLTTNNFTAGVLTPAHNVTLTLAASGVILTATKTSSTETGNSAPFTVVAGAATQLQLLLPGETATPAVSPGKSGTPTAQVAGTAFSVTVNAVDANWNFVNTATTTVHFASNNPNSPVLPADQALSAGTRTYTGVILKTVATPATITASDPSGTSPLASSQSSVNVTAGALDHFTVKNGSNNTLTDQIAGSAFGITVTAQDINNNTVTTFLSTVTLTANNSKFTGNTGSITSGAFTGGVLTQSVTLIVAGSNISITALDTPSGATGTSTPAINVTAGTAVKLQLLVPGETALPGSASGKTGTPTTRTAGVAFDVTVNAVDANWNVANVTPTVHFATNDAGTPTVPTNTALVAGTATFTAGVILTKVSSTTTITVTDVPVNLTGNTSPNITVVAGALNKFTVEASPGGGNITTKVTNTAFPILITAQDAFGNTDLTFNQTVDITSDGTLSAGGGQSAAFSSGTLTPNVTISNEGSWKITATLHSGAPTGVSNAFTVDAPPTVTLTDPANNATGVAVTHTIAITFSKSVTIASAAAFTIECPSGNGARTFTSSPTFPATATLFTLTPTSALPGSTVCTVTVTHGQVTDGTATMQADATFSFTTALSATNDTFSPVAVGNVSIDSHGSGFSVMANDNAGATVTVVSAGWNGTSGATEAGGTVNMTLTGPTKGEFVYDPPAGYTTLTDHFTYTLTDGTNTSNVATVTLTVGAGAIWFIDPSASCGLTCDGRLSHPFTTLSAFQLINDGGTHHATTGQAIFVYGRGSGTATAGNLTLLNNQKLIGSDASGTTPLATISGFAQPTGSTYPGSTGSTAQLSGNVTFGATANATIRGLTLAPTSGAAISGTTTGTLTFANGTTETNDVTINTASGAALDLTSATLSGKLTSVSSSGGTNGINLNTVGGSLTMAAGTLTNASGATVNITNGNANITYAGSVTQANAASIATISSRTGGTVDLSGTLTCTSCTGITVGSNAGTVTFSGGTKTLGTSGTAVSLTSNTGTINFTNGGLAITSASGTAFSATGGGTLNVGTGTNNNTISATGQAMDVNGMTIGSTNVTFASVSSSGGTNNLSFTSNTGNSIILSGGTLTGATGVAFSVNNGTTSINYDGSITKSTAGNIATVTNLPSGAGTIDLHGTLNCTSSCTGVSATTNAGGTINFSGATKTLTAATLTTNTGTAINFTNGGLALSGTFAATSGGTITVGTGTNNNTISSGAARAMNLNGVAIGSGNVTFSSVTSTGGTNNLSFTSVTGNSISLNGGALSGAGTSSFFVSGGSSNIKYSGTVTCSCTGVDVSTTSGTITLDGSSQSITATTTPGVVLLNNTGTVTFSGGNLDITSTTGNGFDASGGGTVIVTGSGNTISTSGTGVALKVSGTTIGTGGLNFQSISTTGTGANAPANGIFLSGTSGTAGLTVAGSGGTCTNANTTGCTGGHLAGTAGTGTSGIGVYLAATLSPSLSHMLIDGTHDMFGIRDSLGTGGITLDNIVMNGSYGASNATEGGALSFVDLSGTGTVTSGYYANGFMNNVRVHAKTLGITLTNLTFTGTTFGLTQSTANAAALRYTADNGTSTVTATSSTFLGAQQSDVEFIPTAGTSNLVLTSNTLGNAQSSPSSTFNSVKIETGGGTDASTGTVDYTIDGNTMTNSQEANLLVSKSWGTYTITGHITNNHFGIDGGAAGSGALAPAIAILHGTQGKHKAIIDNNIIRHYRSNGIVASWTSVPGSAAAENGSLHFTITRNDIQQPDLHGTDNVEGITISPKTSTSVGTTCLNIGHGTSLDANNILNSWLNSGSSWSIAGQIAGAGGAFLKVLGLGVSLTAADVQTLINGDNGVTDGIASGSGLTILASGTTGAGTGVACDLFNAP